MSPFHHPRHLHQYEEGFVEETSEWYQASHCDGNARRWIHNVIATTFRRNASFVRVFSAWREFVKRSRLFEARMKLLRIIFIKWNLFARESLQRQDGLGTISRILQKAQSKRLHRALIFWQELTWVQRAFTSWRKSSMEAAQFDFGILILFQLSRTHLVFRRWRIYSICKKKHREISHTIISTTFQCWKSSILSCKLKQEEMLRISQMSFKLRILRAYVS